MHETLRNKDFDGDKGLLLILAEQGASLKSLVPRHKPPACNPEQSTHWPEAYATFH